MTIRFTKQILALHVKNMNEEEDELIEEAPAPTNFINISISWLPIASVVLYIAIFLSIVILYILNQTTLAIWPSISELARKYPQNKIFAVGFSVEATLFFVLTFVINTSLKTHGIKWANYMYIPSTLSSLFMVAMSSCGLSDNPFLHKIFAVLCFISILIFMICVHIGIMKAKIMKFHKIKFLVILLTSLSVMAICIVSPMEETNVTIGVKAFSEYFLVLQVIIFIGMWVVDLKEVDITFKLS